MTGLRGINFAAETRSSGKVWTSRPHAKNIAARRVWDHFNDQHPINSIKLVGGKWEAEITAGGTATVNAATFRRAS